MPDALFFRPLSCDPPAAVDGQVLLLSAALSSLRSSVLSAHPEIPAAPTSPPAYIVLLSAAEYRAYLSTASAFADIDVSKVYPIGVAASSGTWSVPVVWNAGNIWRAKHGFPPADFHLLLHLLLLLHSTAAATSAPASTSVYAVQGPGVSGGVEVNGVHLPPATDTDTDVLDHLCLFSRLRNDTPAQQLHWAHHLALSHPASEHGYLRLGDLAHAQSWWALSTHCYHAALRLCSAPKRRTYYTKRLVACGAHAIFGPLLTPQDAAHLRVLGPALQSCLLAAPWDARLVPPQFKPAPVDPRTRYLVGPPALQQRLPRFFSWLVPLRLAAMSAPSAAGDVVLLSRYLGVTHVITLTTEAPLPDTWFPLDGGVRNTFVAVENRGAPTVLQMDRVLGLILAEPGATLVHCGGGKGRAGTVLACYLALFGFGGSGGGGAPPQMDTGMALETLRHLRPGSVETVQQERFVAAYVSTAWARHGRGEALVGSAGAIEEPCSAALELELVGDVAAPEVVVLIGLPGSGKSVFGALCKLRSSRVVCDPAIFRRSPPGTSPHARAVLLLDRCHPAHRDRERCSRGAVAVWFDYDVALCTARAEHRTGHELPPWRAGDTVADMARLLEPPTMSEGFSGVARVRSFENALELASLWFGEVGMTKYPRTRHLLDLGSATRDDLVIPPQDLSHYFRRTVTIDEKLDGANLGLSLSTQRTLLVQNRAHYITSSTHTQFRRLDAWLAAHATALQHVLGRDETLPQRYVLFGEWLAATHTVQYDRLPDVFLVFDLYDRVSGGFVSRGELGTVLRGTGLCAVPQVYAGVLEGEEMLLRLLELQSRFAEESVEGVVVRWEDTRERAKMVRRGFVSGQHWSKNQYRKNGLAREGESGEREEGEGGEREEEEREEEEEEEEQEEEEEEEEEEEGIERERGEGEEGAIERSSDGL